MGRLRLAITLPTVLWWLVVAAPAAASGPVAVFPLPGSHYNTLREQIVFRGVAPSAIGAVTVTGSVTGAHTGHIAGDSDGEGASFVPDTPFAPGETVTVSTGLNVLGGTNGTFSFAIANPSGLIPFAKPYTVKAGANGVQHFQSRPDLEPPSITVTRDSAPASAGDIFVAPRDGPVQNGPLILDPHGKVVWFLPYPVSEELAITNFRVQNLFGQPVLTWWQGNTDAGYGRGEGVILNRNYQQIATVQAANGLDEDSHELLLTPQGDAYITAAWPVHLPGVRRGTVDSVVQEIDISTGLVLFEWHSLDHIPLSTTYTKVPPKGLWDPYHLNSIALDGAGNLVLSMRNTSAVYDIDHQSGKVLWSLGGKSSTFKMGKGTSTWGQHDAVVEPDGSLTLFDDGAGPPKVHPYSRGIHERLDTKHKTATLIKEYDHSPRISADFEGSMQALPDGDVFLGWGELSNFSEDTASGKQDFDAHFTVPTASYRAYRFPWTGATARNPRARRRAKLDGPDQSICELERRHRRDRVASPRRSRTWHAEAAGHRRQGGLRDPHRRAQQRAVFRGPGTRSLQQRARHLHRLSHAAPSHDLRWLGVGAAERLRCRAGELRGDRSVPRGRHDHRGTNGHRPYSQRAHRGHGRRRGVLPAQRRWALDARACSWRATARAGHGARQLGCERRRHA